MSNTPSNQELELQRHRNTLKQKQAAKIVLDKYGSKLNATQLLQIRNARSAAEVALLANSFVKDRTLGDQTKTGGVSHKVLEQLSLIVNAEDTTQENFKQKAAFLIAQRDRERMSGEYNPQAYLRYANMESIDQIVAERVKASKININGVNLDDPKNFDDLKNVKEREVALRRDLRTIKSAASVDARVQAEAVQKSKELFLKKVATMSPKQRKELDNFFSMVAENENEQRRSHSDTTRMANFKSAVAHTNAVANAYGVTDQKVLDKLFSQSIKMDPSKRDKATGELVSAKQLQTQKAYGAQFVKVDPDHNYKFVSKLNPSGSISKQKDLDNFFAGVNKRDKELAAISVQQQRQYIRNHPESAAAMAENTQKAYGQMFVPQANAPKAQYVASLKSKLNPSGSVETQKQLDAWFAGVNKAEEAKKKEVASKMIMLNPTGNIKKSQELNKYFAGVKKAEEEKVAAKAVKSAYAGASAQKKRDLDNFFAAQAKRQAELKAQSEWSVKHSAQHKPKSTMGGTSGNNNRSALPTNNLVTVKVGNETGYKPKSGGRTLL